MNQKETFLSGEGDAWYSRNQPALAARDWSRDAAFLALAEIQGLSADTRVLEVGCGSGGRLAELKKRFGCAVWGIDPSVQAVESARSIGVTAQRGTADKLDFPGGYFDVVVLGFCLYLCDRDDLFTIAAEVHRVTKTQAWVLILDFFHKDFAANPYHHRSGLQSFKMDYARLFEWHPWYTKMLHRVGHHATAQLTDSVEDWVSVSLIRKVAPSA